MAIDDPPSLVMVSIDSISDLKMARAMQNFFAIGIMVIKNAPKNVTVSPTAISMDFPY